MNGNINTYFPIPPLPGWLPFSTLKVPLIVFSRPIAGWCGKSGGQGSWQWLCSEAGMEELEVKS